MTSSFKALQQAESYSVSTQQAFSVLYSLHSLYGKDIREHLYSFLDRHEADIDSDAALELRSILYFEQGQLDDSNTLALS